MEEKNKFTVERNDSESRRKWSQMCIAMSVCYICICGGNLIGYTSSAIPSIREGKDSVFHILGQDDSQSVTQSILSLNNSKSNSSIIIGFRVQDEDFSSPTSDNDEDLISRPREYIEFVHLTDAQASWIGGLAPLGAFFGSILATISIKFLGPKGSILQVGGPGFLLSWFMTAFAPQIIYIYMGRIIGGLAMGLTFSSVPLYIVETVSVNLRGQLGTLPQFLFTLGVLMSFVLGSLFDWRTSAIVCGFIVLPVFILLPFIPESPIWLASKNRWDEAEWSYRRVHGFYESNPEWIQRKVEIYSNSNQNPLFSKLQSRSISLIRSSPVALRSSYVAIFLCVFQQLTGINAVNFYTVTIFEVATGPNSYLDGHLSSIIVAIVFCFSNVCSYFLIEKLGRRFLLILSTFLISLSAFALGAYFFILENDWDTGPIFFIPLASLVTFVLAFSIGYGPLLYVIVAEILPSDIRNIVNPIAVGINWLCVFIVAKTFPGMIYAIGASGAFWIYGSCSFISLLFTFFNVPETKGKSELEIQKFFSRRSSLSETEINKRETVDLCV